MIRACRTGKSYSRLGLSISKKVGNAVVRNSWKRLIREGFRRQKNELPAGIDFVVRPRKGACPDHRAIHDSLKKLLQRLDRKMPAWVSPMIGERDAGGSQADGDDSRAGESE